VTPSADIDAIAQALSDPRRAQILDLLAQERCGECCSPENPDAPTALCACDLAPSLGDIAPSKLAYHLKQLRQAGLIDEQQRGKWVYYTLRRAALEGYARAVSERWGQPRPPGRRFKKS
jgi:ArsR family transcriptional regulator, arsenate/arsenite/antimonite-responsive transcriptional repressor